MRKWQRGAWKILQKHYKYIKKRQLYIKLL